MPYVPRTRHDELLTAELNGRKAAARAARYKVELGKATRAIERYRDRLRIQDDKLAEQRDEIAGLRARLELLTKECD